MKIGNCVILLNLTVGMRVARTFERHVREQIHTLLPTEAGKETQTVAEPLFQTEYQCMIVRTSIRPCVVDLREFRVEDGGDRYSVRSAPGP